MRTGVKQGDVIKLTGEGGAAPRGHAPGDLFVNLQVTDEYFLAKIRRALKILEILRDKI